MKIVERRYDLIGPIVLMAVSGSYVMVRRPGYMPFVMEKKKWLLLREKE